MTIRSSDRAGRDPKLVAAVMAAVEAFVADEARAASPQSTGVGAWRMAARHPVEGAQLWRALSWKGRD
ncbi:MAG: hypothetical protein IH956_00255 [Chloroflexi bacterium]|nr:hypothetical protein [Chloroflexota bacterium]